MGVDGLADRLGITKDEAQRLFDQYFGVYTRLKAYMERSIAGAKAAGYITTRFGRKVRIWEFESPEAYVYREGERLAGNAPVQGGAADYMKITMVRVAKAIAQAGLQDKIRLVMNIHDALEFYVADDVPLDVALRLLQPAVTWPVQGWPPMVAEWHAGRRWGSVRELELTSNGSVRLKGSPADPQPERAPAAEDDEAPVDTAAAEAARAVLRRGQEPVRPAPAPAAAGIARTVAASVTSSLSSPRTVLVHVEEMPVRESFARLTAMIQASPGENLAMLVTPEGRYPLGRSAIDPGWQAEISMVLGGAMVCYDLDSVDCSTLARGLEL